MTKRGAFLAFLLSGACAAPPFAELDAVVPTIVANDRIPGAVVLVGEGVGVSYRRAFGTARADSLFDLASVTKVVVTTTLAMKRMEEGKLSLDDPVEKHLPAFAGRPFTVRQLLTHRTGLPAYLTPKAGEPDAILSEIAGLKADGKFRYG